MIKNSLNTHLTYRSTKSKSSYQDLDTFPDVTDKRTNGEREPKIPWKAICLALFLFIFGTAIIVVTILIFTGVIVSFSPNDGLFVLLILGFLMFIPGYYHIRIAYYAYYQYDGYDFEDIPDFD